MLITAVYAFKSLEESRINYFSLVTREMCSMKAEKVKSGIEGKVDRLFIQVEMAVYCFLPPGCHLTSPTSESHRSVPLRFMNSGIFISSNYVHPYILTGSCSKVLCRCVCVCVVVESCRFACREVISEKEAMKVKQMANDDT